MIDLHIHSTYSDGSKTIEEIIELAKQEHLTQFSITDHNTLEGSIRAKLLSPIDFVVGTELSVGYLGEELHLLGYFPHGSNYKNMHFIITSGEISKKIAIMETVERLNKQGYEIDFNELSEFGVGVINRVHICRALMKHGYITSVSEGFTKLVGDHCPAYVPREYVSIEEASNAIHEDGGIAILAHPYNYKHITDIPKMLDDNIQYLDGIECIHPSIADNFEHRAYLLDYAKKHNKLISGGSDFHGDNKPNISLNMMQVPDEYKIIV